MIVRISQGEQSKLFSSPGFVNTELGKALLLNFKGKLVAIYQGWTESFTDDKYLVLYGRSAFVPATVIKPKKTEPIVIDILGVGQWL